MNIFKRWFNAAIFWKSMRESAFLLGTCATGIVAFVILFAWAMVNMGPELMKFVSQFAFLKKIFAVMGIKVDGDVSIDILFAVCFTHAMVMILSWSVVIAASTRTVVGEIEQGTADLLLTLPVTRTQVYVSSTMAWLFSCVLLAACPVLGIWLSTFIFVTETPIDAMNYLAPAVNFMAMLVTIGGIASLVSSMVEQRGFAVAVVIGIGVVSMLLNFLEPFIEQVEQIRFLGLLNYFRPVDVVRTGIWPILNVLILLSAGFVTWAIGLVIFVRKDIPTA